jgi:hypothetical protein
MNFFPVSVPALLSLLVLPTALALDAADRVTIAAMHLSEQPNYSWSVAVSDDVREYTIEGKTELGGYTWKRLPMVKSVAQKLGRTAEPDVEAYFRSESEFVLRAEGGWRTWSELPKRHPDWRDGMDSWSISPRSSPWGSAAIVHHDPFDSTRVIIFQPAPVSADQPRYSNAQFAMSRPHEELAVIVSSCTHLEVDGNEAVGVLSDLGAQLLLVRDGQTHLNPIRAGGAFRLLMRDGVVTRYQLHLEGVLFVDRERVHVHQRSTTEIRAVGETRLDVPDEVRRKLGR